jgi:Tfp pilus assembly protein PilN
VYAVVVASSLLIAFMMLNNVDTYYRYIRETKTTRAKIAQLERQIEDEQKRTDLLNQRLRSVNIKQLSDQTKFVNARLAERAFSWSELLDRLERILPADVRIESIAPSFDKGGMVHLNMTAAAKNGTGMINTLDRLNREPEFANAFPTSEENTPTGYRFGVGVDYKPSIAREIE